jgi:UPF0716 protein FxsA
VELALLIQVGTRIGTPLTIAIVLLTGALGAVLARLAGLVTVRRIQAALAAGQMPANELIDGLLILIAAAMLVTPGVLTDLGALALLTPPGRRLVRHGVGRRLRRAVLQGSVVIDGQATRIDDEPEA